MRSTPTSPALLPLAALLALQLAGCTTLSIESPGGPLAGQRTYVGIVTVAAPVSPDRPLATPRIRQLDVSTLGLRLGGGIGLGWTRDRLLSIPLDCRLVIFIRDTAELAHAEKLLRAITQEDLCTATLND